MASPTLTHTTLEWWDSGNRGTASRAEKTSPSPPGGNVVAAPRAMYLARCAALQPRCARPPAGLVARQLEVMLIVLGGELRPAGTAWRSGAQWQSWREGVVLLCAISWWSVWGGVGDQAAEQDRMEPQREI